MSRGIELADKKMADLEAVIKKYRQDFYAVGKALKEIRDSRYYQRLSFKSFESYARVRWDIRRSQAYRLIDAFAVIDNLSPIGEELPKNEAQVRPLTQLDTHSQKRVWRAFLATGKPLTAVNIQNFVAIQLGVQKGRKPFSEKISKEYQAAVQTMLSQIAVARRDAFRHTSQQTALYWNNVMKEKILWG